MEMPTRTIPQVYPTNTRQPVRAIAGTGPGHHPVGDLATLSTRLVGTTS